MADLGKSLAAASDALEVISRRIHVADPEELTRLRSLCANLVLTLSSRQNNFAADIRMFCDSPTAERWLFLTNSVRELANEVSRTFILLQREEGDFVVEGLSTFRSLVLGLSNRQTLYREIEKMAFPPSPQEIAYLRQVAADYEELRQGLFKVQDELAEYVRLKETERDTVAHRQAMEPTSKHLVILVHGIRDFALWQNTIRRSFEEAEFVVEVTNYGRMNLLQFLSPIGAFRQHAIDTVWKQIRIIKQKHPTSTISVVAHSFGTYIVSYLMRRNFDATFHRVIFCGSVVPYDFPFEEFQNRFSAPIINEVGTRDIWPAVAESVTPGYGSAGTYGFRRPLVRDRWHNGAAHGYFLNAEFCKRFWIPFLKNGELIPGAESAESTRKWLQGLSIVKIKYVIFVVGVLLVSYAVFRGL
jgi:hypothetical protein